MRRGRERDVISLNPKNQEHISISSNLVLPIIAADNYMHL